MDKDNAPATMDYDLDGYGGAALKCPICNDNYLHQVSCEAFFRAEDEAVGPSVYADDAGAVLASTVAPQRRNPSSRRDGIRIRFSCELCHGDPAFNDDTLALCIVQHKGTTYVYWEDVAGGNHANR